MPSTDRNEDNMQPIDDLVEQFAEMLADIEARHQAGIPEVPSPTVIADFVKTARRQWGWKQATLAYMAKVSLSTVERVERGEAISSESLDQIAVAIGQQPGAFTDPRVPLGAAETLERFSRSVAPFEDRVWIAVRPVTGHRQVMELASSHLFLTDAGRLSDACAAEAQGHISGLVEYLDLVSFVISTEAKNSPVTVKRRAPVQRRKLYTDLLNWVRETERQTNSVILAGNYEAETDNDALPKAKVSVLGFFPKSTDPAAIKRRSAAVPARVSIDKAWQNFHVEVDSWDVDGDEPAKPDWPVDTACP
jgi:hypothetical protein